MKKNILALMFIFACFSIGLAQAVMKATAQEKKDLFQLISKNDGMIADAIKDRTLKAADLAKAMKVQKIDLNKNGQPEYIAVIQNVYLCGAHGNCTNWVFRKSDSKYQELLATNGEIFTLEKTSTNKFRDLRVEGSNTAFESSGTVYKFDGNTYKESECYTVTSDGTGKKAKKTVTTCGEGN